MKTIVYSETLDYYDGVQLFEAIDTHGGPYVGMMVDTVGGIDRYLVIGTTSERIGEFRTGAVDLRTLLLEGAVQGWYLAHVADEFAKPLTLEEHDEPVEETDFLPEYGFFLYQVADEDSSVGHADTVGHAAVYQEALDPSAAPSVQLPNFVGAEDWEQAALSEASRQILVLGVGNPQPDFYESVIKPTIERTGFSPVRIERGSGASEMFETIASAITRAHCLVVHVAPTAEGAGNWANSEIDYAAGQGLPIFVVCQEGQRYMQDLVDPLQRPVSLESSCPTSR